MKYIIYYVIGLLILSAAPALILGAIFTVGIYYFLYMLFKGFTSGSSDYFGGGGGSDESDPCDGWHGTGNPYV